MQQATMFEVSGETRAEQKSLNELLEDADAEADRHNILALRRTTTQIETCVARMIQSSNNQIAVSRVNAVFAGIVSKELDASDDLAGRRMREWIRDLKTWLPRLRE